MYTRQKVLSFQFLYTGGNNTCRTEQKTAEKSKSQDNRTENKRQKKRTIQKTTEKRRNRRELDKVKKKNEKHCESCATPNKLLKIYQGQQNKKQWRKTKKKTQNP